MFSNKFSIVFVTDFRLPSPNAYISFKHCFFFIYHLWCVKMKNLQKKLWISSYNVIRWLHNVSEHGHIIVHYVYLMLYIKENIFFIKTKYLRNKNFRLVYVFFYMPTHKRHVSSRIYTSLYISVFWDCLKNVKSLVSLRGNRK